MIFLEFSKRFFTFYFWELECFFVLKRCFSLRPFQWYIVRLATRTGSVSNPNRRIWPYYRLLPPGRRDPHVHVRWCAAVSELSLTRNGELNAGTPTPQSDSLGLHVHAPRQWC